MDKKCEGCSYYGRAVDAPNTVEKDCMYEPYENAADDDSYIDYTLPCERKEQRWKN